MNLYEIIFGNINPLERDFGGERELIVVQAETMAEAKAKALEEICEMFPNSEPEWEGSKSLQK